MPYSQDKRRAVWRKYDRAKMARWRAAGCCVDCGLPVTINPMTGRLFARCFRDRVYNAKAQDLYRRRNRLGRYRVKKPLDN